MPPHLALIAISALLNLGAMQDDSEMDVPFTAVIDGSEQRYVFWLPKGVEDPAGRVLVVALHGHGADRWQFIRESRDECRAVRDVAREQGLVVLSPDYRARTSWMGPAAEADLVQILDDYRSRYSPPRVILCGASMGAAGALTFAVLHPKKIDGVVAMNAIVNHLEFNGFQDAISESFGGSKTDALDEYKKRSAEYFPERFVMPVAFSIGGADDVTPPAGVRRLAAVLKAMGRNALLIERAEDGHATRYDDARALLAYVLAHNVSMAPKS